MLLLTAVNKGSARAGDFVGSSTSSLAIGTGSRVFATQSGEQYTAGMWLKVASRADPTNYMYGIVTGYAGSSLTMTVQSSNGAGTFADWNIAISGPQGPPGTGTPGTAATLSVGTVTTGAAGSSVIIVNSGTANAAVLDITIPRGMDGAGTVSTFSIVAANGLAGTVANPTTSPALTLTTSVTGLVKGNGTALSAAAAGTDYTSPAGTENLSNKTLVNPIVQGPREVKQALAANNIDMAAATAFSKTITGATTFTVSNVPASGYVGVILLNLTNGGAFTVTLWAGIKWAGGTPPTLTTSGRDRLAFITEDGGTTWDGFVLGKAMA